MKPNLELPFVFESGSSEQTMAFGQDLASRLPPPFVLFLHGNLGVGKTLICKGIGRHYGIEGIESPSFARIAINAGEVNLIHCDFYRAKPAEVFYEEEILPLLVDPWILLIEWGEADFWRFECPQFELHGEYMGMNERRFSLSSL